MVRGTKDHINIIIRHCQLELLVLSALEPKKFYTQLLKTNFANYA
jgi:hypothetical protein